MFENGGKKAQPREKPKTPHFNCLPLSAHQLTPGKRSGRGVFQLMSSGCLHLQIALLINCREATLFLLASLMSPAGIRVTL